MDEVLKVKNLKKVFYEKRFVKRRLKSFETKAVDGISFSVKKGEILGLLGPNGAGKTTTIQMLIGSLYPTSGQIHYFGQEFSGEESEILKKINFSSTYTKLPGPLRIQESLEVFGRLYEVSNWRARMEKLLKRFEIWDLRSKKYNDLSEGQRTRVLLVKAFLNYPEVILLDEPTASLDPEIAVKIREFLIEQQEEYQTAMLFTSHNMKEVEEICDRVIFIHQGKIVAEDTPTELVKRFKETQIRLRLESGQSDFIKYMKEKGFHLKEQKGKYIFGIKEEAIGKVLYKLSNLGVRYQDLEIIRPDLEDYFLSIASQSKNKK